MATDDVRLGRAILCLASAIEACYDSMPHQLTKAREIIERELLEARHHLASVDRGKLAATELPEEKEDVA